MSQLSRAEQRDLDRAQRAAGGYRPVVMSGPYWTGYNDCMAEIHDPDYATETARAEYIAGWRAADRRRSIEGLEDW